MLEGLKMFLDALAGFLHPKIIFDVFWSTQLGIIVGMLPGLTATMGVALMTTLTFKMAAENAVIILVCMYIPPFAFLYPVRDTDSYFYPLTKISPAEYDSSPS